MIGASIDQFKIIQGIKKDQISETFLAVHKQDNGKYLLQAISPKLTAQPNFKEKLLKDLVRLIKTHHPNLEGVKNVLDENGKLFVVREFVEGPTLAQMINNLKPGQLVPGYLTLFRDILKGVGHAHSKGFVYRFLSPYNIRVGTDGSARIENLGQVLPRANEQALGREGLVRQARYFSPERFINPETTDIRANIYAIGVILFEMVTGRVPFTGKTYNQLQKQHLEGGKPNPRVVNANAPAQVVEAVARCMAKKPENRFQNTLEIFKFLARVEDGSQVYAGGTTQKQKFNLGAKLSQPQEDDSQGEDASLDDSFEYGVGSKPLPQEINPDSFFDDPPPDAAQVGHDGPELLGAGNPDSLETVRSSGAQLDSPSTPPEDDFGFGADEDSFGFGEAPATDGPEARGNYSFDGLDQEQPSVLEAAFASEGLSKEAAGDAAPGAQDEFGFGGGDAFDLGDENQTDLSSDLDTETGKEALAEGGFDFGSDAPAEVDFGAADNSPTPPDFALGGEDDAFDFGEPEADLGGTDDAPDFDFGGSEPAGDAATDEAFNLGNEAQATPPGDDFGFGDFEKEATPPGDEFGFGTDSPADPFAPDQPADAPASDSQPQNAASGDLGFDAGFDNKADSNFDFGSDTASSNEAGFGFGDPPSGEDDPPPEEDAFAPTGFGDDPFSSPPTENAKGEGDPFSMPEGDPFGASGPDFEKEASPFSDFANEDALQSNAAPPAAEISFADLNDSSDSVSGGNPLGDEPGEELSSLALDLPEDQNDSNKQSTEDGAFTFEEFNEGEQWSSEGNADKALKGLASSISHIDEPDVKRDSPAKQKIVRRVDKKILALTLALAALVFAGGYFFFTNRARKAFEQDVLHNLRIQLENKNYQATMADVSKHLPGNESNAFGVELVQIKQEAGEKKQEAEEQVKVLLERASLFEAKGELLKDGKNDALGTYITIRSLEPQNEKAEQAVAQIKDKKIIEVDSLLAEKQDLKALAILAGLSNADRTDKKIRERYKVLKDRLKGEKSESLQSHIQELYQGKNFDRIVPSLLELEQIDSNSKFLTDMRNNVIDALIGKAQNQKSKGFYGKAEATYNAALKLAPGSQKIMGAQAELTEDRVRSEVRKTLNSLEDAMNRKQLTQQFTLANDLLVLDPGNPVATSALDAANEEINLFQKEADHQVGLGQYKNAAQTLKKIYQINADEETRALWLKYQRWTPPSGMAFVPISPFSMGRNSNKNARPEHKVMVTGFFIDQMEITNQEFYQFVQKHRAWHPTRISSKHHDGNYLRHWKKGKPLADDQRRPVSNVSWFAAKAYAQAQGKRLPSEAEWEKAAAGKTESQKYWWGNYSDAKMAVYEFYTEKKPAKVGSFPANGFGIYEILGNVNEWVEDTYSWTFYASTEGAKDPVNTEAGPEKVFRGGSFRSRGRDLATYMRFFKDPRFCHPTLGFRCAQDNNNPP